MNDNSFIEPLTLIGKIIAVNGNNYKLQLTQGSNKTDQGCCGGYCGIKLWQKIFNIKSDFMSMKLHQHYNLGDHIQFSIKGTHILLLQASLWLLPTLVFLVTLLITPNNIWSLVIAVILVLSSWFIIQKIVKKPWRFIYTKLIQYP